MEPIPETVRAVEDLAPAGDGDPLLERLVEQGRQVTTLVPDCIALALASTEHGVTFVLLASRRQLGLLAAIQHEAADAAPRSPEPPQADLLDEDAWHRHALSGAAPCVATTLTMPVRSPECLAGSVTLYGASRRAFAGLHTQLAEILGAWAPGAITNGDLPFRALGEAVDAPDRLRRHRTLDEAVRIVGLIQEIAPDLARRRIRDAAARAGISEEQLAEAVVRLGRP